MTPKKRRRLAFALALVVAAGAGGAALVVAALKDNVLYFYSPSDLRREARGGRASRSASAGWSRRAASCADPAAEVHFVVTDGRAQRAGGVSTACCPICSAKGRAWWRWARSIAGGVFDASEVLAKHDERYMPPEVVDALKRSGRWKEGETLVTGEIGQLALCLALALAFVQAVRGSRWARAKTRRSRARRRVAAPRSAFSCSSRSHSARSCTASSRRISASSTWRRIRTR